MNKAILKSTLVALAIGLLGFSQVSNAGHPTKAAHAKKVWVCETNASSSDKDADKKADETMKKGKSGAAAFAFALKHCRDCTKITCTVEDTSNTTTNTTTTNTNTTTTNK